MNYIDMNTALQYTVNIDLVKKVQKIFLDEYVNLDIKLLDLTKEEILAVVHKIKGITLNIGAKKLYDKCIEIEESNNFDNELKLFIYTFNKTYKTLLSS